MKYLILVLSLINSFLFSHAQVGTDPNLDIALNPDSRTGVVLDAANANSLKALHIPAEPACPNCASQGNLSLVDENGTLDKGTTSSPTSDDTSMGP